MTARNEQRQEQKQIPFGNDRKKGTAKATAKAMTTAAAMPNAN
jgi:hypothetical protein